MKIFKLFLPLFFLSAVPGFAQTVSTEPLQTQVSSPSVNVVYPYENMKLPNLSKTFIFGNIFPYNASLKINGESVKVASNGGFIAYLPVKEGAFRYEETLFDGISTSTFFRNVYVAEKKQVDISTDSLYLNLISPASNLEVLPGDFITLSVRATPGRKIAWEIEDLANGEMSEFPVNSGYYQAVYRVGEGKYTEGSKIILKFKKGIFTHNIKFISSNTVRVRKNYCVIQTSTDSVILRNDISGGYAMFLPKDVKLVSTGRIGSMWKVDLDEKTFWVEDSKVSLLSCDIRKPKTETGNLVFSSSGKNRVSAQLSIYERVPYVIYEENNSLVLELYYSNLHTNWIIYDSSDSYTKNVNFRQVGENVCRFVFNFSEGKKLWGYDINYSGNSLILDFKFKPELGNNPLKPLEGACVVLDPGHSPKREPPFDGAIGPKGSFEYEVNLKIARKLYDKLSNLGATVYMTRYGDENVPLSSRPQLAKQYNGDLFVSVHNNAIADGEDPFAKPRGFQIYYNHPHSMDLGLKIHDSFVKNIPLPDEGLRYGDYYVIRQTYMPAVLVENAYMIIPEQEEMINDDKWEDKFADAIKQGIYDFLKQR